MPSVIFIQLGLECLAWQGMLPEESTHEGDDVSFEINITILSVLLTHLEFCGGLSHVSVLQVLD